MRRASDHSIILVSFYLVLTFQLFWIICIYVMYRISPGPLSTIPARPSSSSSFLFHMNSRSLQNLNVNLPAATAAESTSILDPVFSTDGRGVA